MKSMKVLVLCMVLVGSSLAVALPVISLDDVKMHSSSVLDPSGTFTGVIGFRVQGNWTSVGALNGSYVLRNRFGRFDGDWTIHRQNENISGTMRGGFGHHILIGRIAVEGRNHTLPIIGFIGFRNETFFGRFMSIIGPALYFKGTYI